jgi:hypothetical protein
MGEGFVTIAEASRRLGVDPRQVRRYVEKLPDSDKCPDTDRTRNGQPSTRVRFSALANLRGKGVSSSNNSDIDRTLDKETVLTETGQKEETDRTLTGHLNDALRRAEVAEARAALLESETNFLRSALEREQQNTARALDQLQEAENRSKIIMGAMATGQISPKIAQGIDSDASTAKDEQEAVLKSENRPAEGLYLHKWWQFWGKG